MNLSSSKFQTDYLVRSKPLLLSSKRASIPTGQRKHQIPSILIDSEYNKNSFSPKTAIFKDIKSKLLNFLKIKRTTKTEYCLETDFSNNSPFKTNLSAKINKNSLRNEYNNDYMLNKKSVESLFNSKKRQNTEKLRKIHSKLDFNEGSTAVSIAKNRRIKDNKEKFFNFKEILERTKGLLAFYQHKDKINQEKIMFLKKKLEKYRLKKHFNK